MALQLGEIAPDFEAETTEGRLRFHLWLGGNWGVLFSHPRDFTPVCTTELGMVAKLKGEFARRRTKVVGLSVDGLADHRQWVGDIEETQSVRLNFPIIADPDGRVARIYGMIHEREEPGATVRSVFVISPDKKIKLTLTYPASTGRNFQEILRVIDSLQLSDRHCVATPADWENGDDVFVMPTLSDEDARRRFPEGFRQVKPYLRIIRQPPIR